MPTPFMPPYYDVIATLPLMPITLFSALLMPPRLIDTLLPDLLMLMPLISC